MRVKSQKDFWSGLMFMVIGAAFAWGSLNYSFGSSARPGPAYFPFGLGVLMALLGAVVLFKALTVETADGEPIGAWAWRPLLMIVGALVFVGWALPTLGMFVALPALVIVAALGGDEFRWKDAVLNAAVLTVMSWGIFVWGLSLNIPLWPSLRLASGT
jgi:hypothetical protein